MVVKAEGTIKTNLTSLVQVKVGDSFTTLKLYKNGLYEAAENYKCIKQIEATSYGERIVYICEYEEDD